jgi:hypothetical protein
MDGAKGLHSEGDLGDRPIPPASALIFHRRIFMQLRKPFCRL